MEAGKPKIPIKPLLLPKPKVKQDVHRPTISKPPPRPPPPDTQRISVPPPRPPPVKTPRSNPAPPPKPPRLKSRSPKYVEVKFLENMRDPTSKLGVPVLPSPVSTSSIDSGLSQSSGKTVRKPLNEASESRVKLMKSLFEVDSPTSELQKERSKGNSYDDITIDLCYNVLYDASPVAQPRKRSKHELAEKIYATPTATKRRSAIEKDILAEYASVGCAAPPGKHLIRRSDQSDLEVIVDETGYAVPMGLPNERRAVQKQRRFQSFRRNLAQMFDNALTSKYVKDPNSSESDATSTTGSTPQPQISPSSASTGPDDDSTDADCIIYSSEIRKRREIYKSSLKLLEETSAEQPDSSLLSGLAPLSGDIGTELFQCATVVRLVCDPEGVYYYDTELTYPSVSSVNMNIPLFCYPEIEFNSNSHLIQRNMDCNEYSFVLTTISAEREYGYCLRVSKPGHLPDVLCILSSFNCATFYFALLKRWGQLWLSNHTDAHTFIEEIFTKPLPSAGRSIWVSLTDSSGSVRSFTFLRPLDFRVGGLECLKDLGADLTLKLFSSILLERRVILVSDELCRLSSISSALLSLLYPFDWQHTFVPILPQSMLEICCCPAPFIVGILNKNLGKIVGFPLEETFIVDLDERKAWRSRGDEANILPKKLSEQLRDAWIMCTSTSEIPVEARLREMFLHFFLSAVGHYPRFIVQARNSDSSKQFNRQGFLTGTSSNSLRRFLTWFMETQMFEVFESKITNQVDASDLVSFNQAVLQMQDDASTFSVKQWSRKMTDVCRSAFQKVRIFRNHSNSAFV